MITDFIISNLDADDVIDELIQERLIGQMAMQRLQLMGMSSVNKNHLIFQQLTIAGPDTLEKFCEKIKGKRQSFIVERLEKCELGHVA